MHSHYDVIVIGSGAAGGVLAHDLQQAGASCLLLEAGKHYTKETFPRSELEYSPQLFWGGGLEFDSSGKMAFLRARCVGGTTNVNQCLLDRFDDLAWADWQRDSGVPFFNTATMAPHYEAIESRLSLQTIAPEQFNHNTRLFIEGCDKHGFGWAPLRRGQSDCALDQGNDCIGCLGGCHRDSKQSTLVGFIQPALRAGLSIQAGFEVGQVEPIADGVRVQGLVDGRKVSVTGRKVVLAAGALGSTKILLQSGFGKHLPALGQHFSSHPQFMSFGRFADTIDAHKGAFQGVKSQDAHFRAAGFKLENVFGPPISIAMLYPRLGGAHQRFMQHYRQLACIEVAIRDEAIGRLQLDRKGRLRIHKPLTLQDLRRRDQGLSTVQQMFWSLGAEEVFSSDFYFGLHLMGGCRMGSDPREAVVGPDFKVHGQPHLYVADSALFPNAPGINPALSIMALAQRLGQQLTGADA
ncbi:MAG: GMC family oxidoreductase [Candidatus Sericytochromatia bacterium]|nr:GMC family oxidoreductase [Candidatus Sericytochromatia bacterium]